jgi:DHA1 family multidrug resistance protein-like MFS transporter
VAFFFSLTTLNRKNYNILSPSSVQAVKSARGPTIIHQPKEKKRMYTHEPEQQAGVTPEAPPGQTNSQRTLHILILLTASMTLLMTGHGIVLPIFGKRLGEMGAGVTELGIMTMGFSLAQFLISPLMGKWADSLGRRPLILLGLAGFAFSNIAFLLAQSPLAFIIIRTIEGFISAALLPASMGVIADIVPEHQRARWTGLVMGGYTAGFILGPLLGGVIFDHWGYAAPFAISAGLAFLATLTALILVPETRQNEKQVPMQRKQGFFASLPNPLFLFICMLLMDFTIVFGFAFIEPQMTFYLYDQMHFSSTEFGAIVGTYGLAMLIGQMALGSVSDKIGRKWPVVFGLLFDCVLYLGLILLHNVYLMFAASLIAGLGASLVSPALSAAYLDMADEDHRAQTMGVRSSITALGGVLGPLLSTILSKVVGAHAIFAIACGLTLFNSLLALLTLRNTRPSRT